MITLSTFGALDLRGPDGRELERILTQTKRLALLVYLALAGPRRFRRRDTVLALFWPELDEEHARSALRQALSFLRQHLGEGVLAGRGDEEIGIGEGEVWCDAVALESALAAADPAAALALYRGEFLDGFHVAGAAPELEEWIAGERRRLRGLAARAAWDLAESARRSGDGNDAVRWATRAASLAPDDEGAIRRLIACLDESGDRAGALEAYDRLVERLADAYAVEPSADTQALAAAVRAGSTRHPPGGSAVHAGIEAPAVGPAAAGSPRGTDARTPSGEALPKMGSRRAATLASLAAVGALAIGGYLVAFRPRPAPPLDPSLIVVGMFENRTGDPALDLVSEMAADWVVRGLMRTGEVKVVDARPWVEFRELADSIRGRGAAGARMLATKTGAGTVVWGNLYRQGDRIEFRAHITDASSGRLLRAVEPATGPIAEPLAAVEALRARVTGSLATVVDPGLRSWAGLASQPPNYEAYREFLRGVEAHYAWNFRDALPLYLKAAARDSSFTLPLALASHVAWKSGRCDLTDSIDAELEPVRERLPMFDRSQLEWSLAACHGDMRAGLEAARRARQVASGSDYVAWVYAWWAMRNRRPREALAALDGLDPGSGFFLGRDLHLAAVTEAYHSLGEYREELEVSRRYHQRFPDRLPAIGYQIRALAALGRVAEAQALLAEAERLGSDPNATPADILLAASRELESHGHAGASRAAAEGAIAWLASHRPREEDDGRHQLGEALYLARRWEDAEATLKQIADRDPEDLYVRGLRGVIAARRGDRIGAERIAGEFATLPEPYVPGHHTLWRAEIAAALGDGDRAVALLRQAYDEGLPFRGAWHAEPAWEGVRDRPSFLALVRVEE